MYVAAPCLAQRTYVKSTNFKCNYFFNMSGYPDYPIEVGYTAKMQKSEKVLFLI